MICSVCARAYLRRVNADNALLLQRHCCVIHAFGMRFLHSACASFFLFFTSGLMRTPILYNTNVLHSSAAVGLANSQLWACYGRSPTSKSWHFGVCRFADVLLPSVAMSSFHDRPLSMSERRRLVASSRSVSLEYQAVCFLSFLLPLQIGH